MSGDAIFVEIEGRGLAPIPNQQIPSLTQAAPNLIETLFTSLIPYCLSREASKIFFFLLVFFLYRLHYMPHHASTEPQTCCYVASCPGPDKIQACLA